MPAGSDHACQAIPDIFLLTSDDNTFRLHVLTDLNPGQGKESPLSVFSSRLSDLAVARFTQREKEKNSYEHVHNSLES
jgi:hypothetical protein